MTFSKKIYGTTIYIGENNVKTQFGLFKSYTFQNLIASKNYVIALCFGEIFNEKELYTRPHSSCVTSETFTGCDCDCVEQLNGALEKISQSKAGILFYLIQEGRGAGYVAKSRDRMMVQYSRDTLSTFEAYKQLGLKNDHRDYTMIKEISQIMEINPAWIMLTNNPDKVNSFTDLGLTVSRTESLEFKPGPYNLAYLKSKEAYGHKLKKIFDTNFDISLKKEPVKPFEPHPLEGSKRFILCSSYYLPIRPVKNTVVLNKNDVEILKEIAKNNDLIKYNVEIRGNKYFVIFDETMDALEEIPQEIEKYFYHPYWFRVYVYYDISTSNDYVILEYQRKEHPSIPIVRIHSEAIFSRFPLEEDQYKDVYKKSVYEIVKHGYGFIGLFYQDGRGHGLGAYVLDQMFSSKETGILYDVRDYHGITQLIKNHMGGEDKLHLITTGLKNDEILKQLRRLELNVVNTIYLGNDDLGHNLLSLRHELSQNMFNKVETIFNDYSPTNFNWFKNQTFVTGVGSSTAHAQYLVYLARKAGLFNIEYQPITWFEDKVDYKTRDCNLILFSQGLSPNAQILYKLNWLNIILFTSVSYDNEDLEKIKLLNKSNLVVKYPLENEYGTLIRFVGPMAGFYAASHFAKKQGWILPIDFNTRINFDFRDGEINDVSQFITVNKPNIKIIFDVKEINKESLLNLQLKFLEGLFYPSLPEILDALEFSHGFYQNTLYQNRQGNKNLIILLNPGFSKNISSLRRLIEGKCHLWEINQNFGSNLNMIYYEYIFNEVVLRVIKNWNVNQKNWEGDDASNPLYLKKT